MKKYNQVIYTKFKIIINILTSIILIYGLCTYVVIHNKNFNGDSMIMMGGLIPIGIIVIGHLSVFIHEVGHAIALKAMGIRVKIFQAGPVKFINSTKRKLVFNKVGLLLIGGYIIPEVSPIVYNKSTLKKFKEQYIKFIFSGILVTLLILIIAAILIIFNIGIIINLLIVIVNWAILLKSLDNKNLSYGDFYLIKLLKDKPNYICAVLQNNLMVEYPINQFLETRIEEFLKTLINKENYDELILGLADKVLDNYIIEEKQLCCELEKLKQWIFNNYEGSKDDTLISKLTLVKVSYKFILYDYIFGTKSEFISNYNKIMSFLVINNDLKNHELIERIIDTLRFLYEDRNIFQEDFKYIISDLELLEGECENCRKKISLIVDKIIRRNM